MIKIGLIGAGHLGKIHLRLLKQLTEDFELIGFYDHNPVNAAAIAAEYQVPSYDSMERLIEQADALDVVTPTTTHFEIASLVVKASKHLFIEKPLTTTVEEARALANLVKEANVRCMVGHVERFNGAMLAVESLDLKPVFIEVHRLNPWNPRGTDVSVVLDLMIHDIEIVQYLIKSPVKRVSANGMAILSNSADIANARIEFHNGAVANLTTNRMAFNTLRRMRVFERERYVTVDFGQKKASVHTLHRGIAGDFVGEKIEFDGAANPAFVTVDYPEVPNVNSIQRELSLFAKSIRENTEPPVTVEQGADSIETAYQIIQKIESQNF
jgi:predicted dehydrogenase